MLWEMQDKTVSSWTFQKKVHLCRADKTTASLSRQFEKQFRSFEKSILGYVQTDSWVWITNGPYIQLKQNQLKLIGR